MASSLVVMDFCYLVPEQADVLRQRLSITCQMPAERILLQCTHNHASPRTADFLYDTLAERLIAPITEARGRAEPAMMAFAQVDTGRRFNINRRKIVDDVGTFTTWMGWKDRDGEPDGGDLIRARLAHWRGRPVDESEVQGPILYDGPTDGLVQAVFFQTLSGRPIGSLVRYCAHPAAAGHDAPRQFSPDYPLTIRRRMDEAFGGQSAFLIGPCGNLNMWERGEWPEQIFAAGQAGQMYFGPPWMHQQQPDRGFQEGQRIGNGLADALLPHLPSRDDFRPCQSMKFVPAKVMLPVRNDLLEDRDQAARQARELTEKFHKVRATLPLRQLRTMAQQIFFMELHSYTAVHYLTPEQLRRRQVTVQTPLLALDDVMFLGFPGEVFWQTARPAFDTAAQRGRKLISLSYIHANFSYMPTEVDRLGEDYECASSIYAAGAEQQLRDATERLVREMA